MTPPGSIRLIVSARSRPRLTSDPRAGLSRPAGQTITTGCERCWAEGAARRHRFHVDYPHKLEPGAAAAPDDRIEELRARLSVADADRLGRRPESTDPGGRCQPRLHHAAGAEGHRCSRPPALGSGVEGGRVDQGTSTRYR